MTHPILFPNLQSDPTVMAARAVIADVSNLTLTAAALHKEIPTGHTWVQGDERYRVFQDSFPTETGRTFSTLVLIPGHGIFHAMLAGDDKYTY